MKLSHTHESIIITVISMLYKGNKHIWFCRNRRLYIRPFMLPPWCLLHESFDQFFPTHSGWSNFIHFWHGVSFLSDADSSSDIFFDLVSVMEQEAMF